jgi:glutamyl-Q tRNA(Asp) synthetase
METTRFAPSSNGPLHLGHAYSAIVSHDRAREAGGRFVLRIEDIDGPRSRPELPEAFRADLAWLGLEWTAVAAQSTRLARYRAAAGRLRAMGLLYPCTCTRAEIAAAAAAHGPEGPIYSGTCRGRAGDPAGAAWRLDMARAIESAGPLVWQDELAGTQHARPELLGDVVLMRKDAPASYHLAVTLDDADDGVTLVTRGRDLFAATHVHRLLQALLDLPVPRWHHHGLLVDSGGHKLAKRRGSGAAGFGISDRRLAGEDGSALADALRGHRFPAGISLADA